VTDDPGVVRKAVTAAAQRVDAARRGMVDAQREYTEACQDLADALAARAELPGRQRWACGTTAGYRRHTREGSIPCYPCVLATRWARQALDARRKV
jgi:hypothetical protein